MINVNSLGSRAKRAAELAVPRPWLDWIARLFVIRFLRLWLTFNVSLRRNLTRQLSHRFAGQSAPQTDKGPRILIPLIETSHYQIFQVLIIAKALQIRGAHVKVLICGQQLTGCEIKSVRHSGIFDPCFTCRFNERNVLPLFGLDVIRLSDFVTKSERDAFAREAKEIIKNYPQSLYRHGVDLIKMVEDSVIRYFYGAIPDDENAVNLVRVDHLSTALLNIQVAKHLHDTWKPSVVFTNMFCYSAWEPYFRFSQNQGIHFCSVSMAPFDYHKLRINNFDLFQSTYRFIRYRDSRDGRPLDLAEKKELDRFISQRTNGESKIFLDNTYFKTRPCAELRRRLNIDENKRNVFLFPNVYWDTGLSDCGGLFQDVITWVLETIETARKHPDCHLYIKPHPAEVFDSSRSLKGIAQVIRERYPNLPANVTIIEPAWKLNTYQLFPFIDVGVIFTGTLGLEMMLAGIPVVSTGSTSHQNLGFAQEPQTLESYEAALFTRTAPPAVDREQLELFAFFYFIRTLIPWRLTKTAFANADFDGFEIESLDDLQPGRDPYLDHICNCLLDPENAVIEAWPDETKFRTTASRLVSLNKIGQ